MSDKRRFQLNIKFGGGYEAPLLNIEGDDAQEFQRNVEFAVSSLEAIVDAAVLFQASYNVKKPQDAPQGGQHPTARPQGSWSSQGSQQASAPAAEAPNGPAPSCRHGAMVYKPGGFSQRTNKAYNAFWACPSRDRSDQCKSQNA